MCAEGSSVCLYMCASKERHKVFRESWIKISFCGNDAGLGAAKWGTENTHMLLSSLHAHTHTHKHHASNQPLCSPIYTQHTCPPAPRVIITRQTDSQARWCGVWQPSVCQFTFITHLAPISHSSVYAGLHAWICHISFPPSMPCFIHQPHFYHLSSPVLSTSPCDGAEGVRRGK